MKLQILLVRPILFIIKCYKRVFFNKNITECYGFFIIIGFIIIQIITTILYYNKSLYFIRKYLFAFGNKYFLYLSSMNRNKISLSSKNINTNPNYNSIIINNLANYNDSAKKKLKEKNKKEEKGITTRRKFSKKSIINENNNIILNLNRKSKFNNIINLQKHSKNKRNVKYSSKLLAPQKLSFKESYSKNESPSSNIELFDKSNSILYKDMNLNIDIKQFLSTEIDEMNYDEIIMKDKRTFKEYFFEKLKSNQIILNTFLENEPLKPKTMKIILLIIDFILYFFINALFFNEEYISKIFHSKKKKHFLVFYQDLLVDFYIQQLLVQ